MREIKFRAWSSGRKEMTEVENINFKGNAVYLISKYLRLVANLDETELMQYTGLQDKNGVDIYEGDIINLSYEYFDGHFRDNEIVGKVYFEDSSFRMSYKKYDEIREWRIDEPEILSIEVIGNIYENPELLEV